MSARKKRAPGRPRADEQKEPTQGQILRAAADLFFAHGYKNVSVDDVAAKCHVTKATVYYYYGSKAELFTETMLQLMVRIREYMEAMLQEDTPLRERLENVAVAHLRATVDIDMDAYMRETRNILTAEQMKEMQEAENQLFSVLERAFEEAAASGEIAEGNTKFYAHAYNSLLRIGNYRNSANEGIFPSVEAAAGEMIDFFWRGIAK
ncbi:TetR/AcrR family transcriptional regulator [Indiicoccus explosivorum]|uniref:TetR/AcrR family transcriptional regulator n=1 Tax=Indiicoccus explosivorum TaxID=1917864 RepID=UPI0013905529|nr:TetR/AcrR family transcriptional regulator [Indiicoccus explosivorum]